MMFLPKELRDELAQRGITAPDDATPELDRWMQALRTESPEVYRLVLAHASASAPELDSEQLQARRQRTGAPARTVRRIFSRRTAAGERVANRKLALTSVLGIVLVVIIVGTIVSGLRQISRRGAVEPPAPPPVAETPAPAPSPPTASVASPAPEPSAPPTQQQPSQSAQAGQIPQLNLPSQPSTVALPPLPGNTGAVPSVPGIGGSGPVVFERPRQGLSAAVVAYERSAGNEEAAALAPAQGVVVYEASKPAGQGAPSGAQIITPGSGASAGAGTQPAAPAKPVPAAPALQPGQRIEARLLTGIVVAEGAAPTPVVVASKEGTWLGAAQLGPGGRVQVALQQLISENAVATVQALVLDKETQAPGLAGKARTVNAQTAQTLLACVAQGVAEFMKATANASQVTTTNGFLTITSGQAGPWWSYILGGVATQVPQMTPQGSRPVTVVEIGKDQAVTILVLSAPGATP